MTNSGVISILDATKKGRRVRISFPSRPNTSLFHSLNPSDAQPSTVIFDEVGIEGRSFALVMSGTTYKMLETVFRRATKRSKFEPSTLRTEEGKMRYESMLSRYTVTCSNRKSVHVDWDLDYADWDIGGIEDEEESKEVDGERQFTDVSRAESPS